MKCLLEEQQEQLEVERERHQQEERRRQEQEMQWNIEMEHLREQKNNWERQREEWEHRRDREREEWERDRQQVEEERDREVAFINSRSQVDEPARPTGVSGGRVGAASMSPPPLPLLNRSSPAPISTPERGTAESPLPLPVRPQAPTPAALMGKLRPAATPSPIPANCPLTPYVHAQAVPLQPAEATAMHPFALNAAAALDMADGVLDGRFFGKEIRFTPHQNDARVRAHHHPYSFICPLS